MQLATDSYEAAVHDAKAQFALFALAIAQSAEALERANSILGTLSEELTEEQCQEALDLNETADSRKDAAKQALDASIRYPGFPFTFYARFAVAKSRVALYEKPRSVWLTANEESHYSVYLNGREIQIEDREFAHPSDLDDLHPAYLEYTADEE